MVAQDTVRFYQDTLSASSLISAGSDDQLLFQLIGQQSERLQAQEDSIHQYRLEHDLTTVVPLHLGYADSLRIAKRLKESGGRTIWALPLLYMPESAQPLPTLDYSYSTGPSVSDSIAGLRSLSPRLGNPVRAARRYMNAHAAGLYAGVFDSTIIAKPEEGSRQSVYELSVPTKSLVRDTEEDQKEHLNALKYKDTPWFKELHLMLQFTQNYVSPNWYEGGNSSLSMYSSAKGSIKYDDKKRITWENYGEWTAGVSTISGDSLRKFTCSEDLFRLYSKLGVKIIPKLYGSFDMEFRTQLFPTYKPNTRTLKTGFFTPIRFNLALGVDYKPVKGLSLVVSPGAFKLVYANDTIRAPYTSYGIKEGEKVLAEFGSSVRVEWQWKPLREIALDTKFYAYTNYHMIELDMEVNCDFIINRFITARVKLHPRYDSSRIVDDDKRAKMQFKELISIGFAHKFH